MRSINFACTHFGACTVQHTHTHTRRRDFPFKKRHITHFRRTGHSHSVHAKKIHTLQQAGYLPKVPSLLHWVKGHDFNYTVIDEMRNVLNDESVIYRTSSPHCKVAITFFSRTFYTHIQKTGSIFFKYTALSSTS